jgi:CBS domain-containing protein
MEYPSFTTRGGASFAAGSIYFSTLQAKDVMQYGVVSVGEDEPVHRAIRLLLDKRINGLTVAHEGRLTGILSEKDVLRLLYEQEYLPGVVREYMSRDIVTFDIEDSFSDICECLIRHSLRRVPILSHGRLVGIVGRADIIRKMSAIFKGRATSYDN